MPLIGPNPEGGTFFCSHCGALYSVTYSRLSRVATSQNVWSACKLWMSGIQPTPIPNSFIGLKTRDPLPAWRRDVC
jgi:hypothetical protein